jgi:hypothetical protein
LIETCRESTDAARAPRSIPPASQSEPLLATMTDAPESSRETSAFAIQLNALGWRDPFRWLALGWRDFLRCPGIGLFYGVCFTVMGWALMKVYEQAPAFAGSLPVGPAAPRAAIAGSRPALRRGT